MKKIVLALCLLIAGASAATAQKPSCPNNAPAEKSCCMKKDKADKKKCCKKDKDARHGKKDKQEMLFKGIELTPAQQAELKVLRDKQGKNMDKDMKKMKESREKRMKEYDKGLAKILTPEQMATYNANKAQLRSKQHKHGKQDSVKFKRHGASRPDSPTMSRE